MNADLSILEGSYLSDLLAQPRAISDTLLALRGTGGLPSEALAKGHVVLTGMGCSLHALHPTLIRLVAAGRNVVMIETSELLYAQAGLLTSDTLLVVVSQSGRSAEILTLLDRVAGTGAFVVGVTNTPDAPLALRADLVVPVRAGVEATVSCKTFLASLVSLAWFAAALCGDDLAGLDRELSALPAAVDAYLAGREAHIHELMEELRGMRHLFITGRGASLAAAGTAGLTIKESTHVHAEGMTSPAFRHGPFEMVSPGLFAAVLAGDPSTAGLNEKLVTDIITAGGKAALVGPTSRVRAFQIPSMGTQARPVVEMLPFQMMSLALAALARRTPGVFEHITKVTDSE